MNLEIKTYIENVYELTPEKETDYSGYIEMNKLENLDVFNKEFGRSGGYPSGRVDFCIDGKPIGINSEVDELYTFWRSILKSFNTNGLTIEKSDWTLRYTNEEYMDFYIRFYYQKKVVEFHHNNKVIATFTLDDYKKALLKGFLDFMWHTNLEFETITHDSLGDEIDYSVFREDIGNDLYDCRYIFLQFMKEMYKQNNNNFESLIDFEFDYGRYLKKVTYEE